jgi:hypothetical protein
MNINQPKMMIKRVCLPVFALAVWVRASVVGGKEL